MNGLAAAAAALSIAGAFTVPARMEYRAPDPAPYEEVTATVTAYSSSEDETDDTPAVTASGTTTRDGIAACPRRHPFGTRVEIEGREYECEDRMAPKYGDRFDVWMGSKGEAREWGSRTLQVRIKTQQ